MPQVGRVGLVGRVGRVDLVDGVGQQLPQRRAMKALVDAAGILRR